MPSLTSSSLVINIDLHTIRPHSKEPWDYARVGIDLIRGFKAVDCITWDESFENVDYRVA